MTDLLDRLRGNAPSILAMRDAADEIERLRNFYGLIRAKAGGAGDDIVAQLNFIAGSRQSDLNDDGHIIASGAAEIERLRAKVAQLQDVLVAFIQTSETGIAAKIIDGAPSLEPFRQYLRAKP